MGTEERTPNRLIHETSPYLRQHAHNPVQWYAWGEEALATARREDKPILLSIGYAACHWCHVMERESFENEAIAALMNQHFVCIKVDREERPDLDDIYMAATIAMSGHGGWPMTVFLTPDQRPFFAGTYFPPDERYGRPGFPTLLARVAEVFREDRAGVDQQAQQLTSAVRAQLEALARAEVSSELIDQAVQQLSDAYDPAYGGFGNAPKFPPSSSLRLLLRAHARSGDPRCLELVRGTLDGMRKGGMFDHVGGGFARYSTDARWHVPHFEKMLYDNAQLARVYLEAFQVTGDPAYQRVAVETLDYVVREMQSERGGFYSATDADSEGVEGKFFSFTRAELAAILEEPLLGSFAAYYDARADGNWEGTNVLWTPRSLEQVSSELGIDPALLSERLEQARPRVYAARQQRVPPLLDDKILVS
ncbi:MAG TPA: thioredoxin domain-containing protein, partial [Polyangiaceae bacterium]|nr:thioredoxin domain-containing protein [Polyangiaceae bacterium]